MKLIPHGPGMCLIDRVRGYDSVHIKCETESHTSTSNPLTENGKLHSISLVEYASQAAAIHAALNQQTFTQGKPAFIGSVKNIILNTSSIENLAAPLLIEAKCVLSGPSGAIYEFSVFAVELVAAGQINLILPT